MKIEILGSGGAHATPAAGCTCRVCVEAREKGLPYSRTGPGVFVHGPDVLFDTSEDIHHQLNRAGIMRIPACLYSHWHPDHVLGYRVWETLNGDWRGWPPKHRTTDIYLPQQVAADFRAGRLAAWDQLMYLRRMGVIRVTELADGEVVTMNGTTISPFRLAEDYVYAFLLEEGDTRVLIAPDELYGWEPPAFVHSVDLAVIPMGLVEFDLFTGERRIPKDHKVLTFEATFRQTLDIVRAMQPKRAILTHVEEPDELSYDDLRRVEEKLSAEGFNITFAYDTMTIEV